MITAFLALAKTRPRRLRVTDTLDRSHGVLYSDATGRGELGVVLLDNAVGFFARGTCPAWLADLLHDHRHAVNQYETLAAVCALLTFGIHLQRRRVALFVDNTSALIVLSRGHSPKDDMCRLAALFHAYACNLDTDLFIEYVPSKENLADIPSRGTDHTQWDELTAMAPTEVALVFPTREEWTDPSLLLHRSPQPITVVHNY